MPLACLCPARRSIAVTALLKLAGFTNDLRYVNIAREEQA